MPASPHNQYPGKPEGQSDSAAEYLNTLASHPRITKREITGNVRLSFRPENIGGQNAALVRFPYVAEPAAVIRTGMHSHGETEGDNYVLYKVSEIGKDFNRDAFVLAHLAKDALEQPHVVGRVTEEGLDIGRERFDTAGNPTAEDLTTSRNHFTVSTDRDGNVAVHNFGANGTELLFSYGGDADPEAQTVVTTPSAVTVAFEGVNRALNIADRGAGLQNPLDGVQWRTGMAELAQTAFPSAPTLPGSAPTQPIIAHIPDFRR